MTRKIIHIDMDCFYAAIEMRDRPGLRNRPIAVGGRPDQRGVLCTSNYIARRYGVRSAMASAYALRLCPELLILPVDMAKYRAVSQQIREIFADYTDLIEPLSLDEAYLDVTDSGHCHNSATLIAKEIRQRIVDTQQLTASAGVAPNKFLAKIASDWQKPNGQYVIPPGQIDCFVQNLPVQKIFGVGKVMAQKLAAMHIKTCGELQALSEEVLITQLGRFGQQLYQLARGVDERPVEPSRLRKSVSVEHTYPQDLLTLTACMREFPKLVADLERRLQQYKHRLINKQFVKIKFNDFQTTTVGTVIRTLSYDLYRQLIAAGFERQSKPVRLLGLGVGFAEQDSVQVELAL